MSEPTYIKFEVEDRIGVITLDRPKQRNAQDRIFLEQLDAAWRQAEQDPAVKVIVLAANGPHFSAGHDLSGPNAHGPFDWDNEGAEPQYRYERSHFLGYSRQWRDISKPSIAAVQGKCIAAGLMLCWPCDLIVAGESAEFSDPVVNLGIGGVEYHGHTWEWGPRKAKEILFTCESLTAREAQSLGMVNRVVKDDEILEEAMRLARKIAEKDSFGLAMAKRAVNQTLDVQGQYAALQSVFDIHSVGHGSAYARCQSPILFGLEDMKEKNRK